MTRISFSLIALSTILFMDLLFTNSFLFSAAFALVNVDFADITIVSSALTLFSYVVSVLQHLLSLDGGRYETMFVLVC